MKIGRFPYLANGRALAMGEPEGWVKVVAHGGDGRILWVHILGARASDLIASLPWPFGMALPPQSWPRRFTPIPPWRRSSRRPPRGSSV